MPLARKVARGKWASLPFLGEEDASADAVTRDLPTTENSLSFWECDTASIEEAALAIAAAGDRVDTFHIAIVETEQLVSARIPTQHTPGGRIEDLRHTHVDLVELSADRLAIVANLVAQGVRSTERCKCFRKRQVLALLRAAIDRRRVELEDLPEKIREQLERAGPGG